MLPISVYQILNDKTELIQQFSTEYGINRLQKVDGYWNFAWFYVISIIVRAAINQSEIDKILTKSFHNTTASFRSCFEENLKISF